MELVYYADPKIPVNFNGFVYFYKDDYKFESIWKYPKAALQKLKRFAGIITPDFSTYRMRAFGYWLGKQGCQVINNVRWDNPDSYKYCFDGIPQNSIVAVSTVGCLKNKNDQWRFVKGLEVMVGRLNPSHILVYGKAGRNFFDKYIKYGIPVTFYDQPDFHTFTTKKTTTLMKAGKFVRAKGKAESSKELTAIKLLQLPLKINFRLMIRS